MTRNDPSSSEVVWTATDLAEDPHGHGEKADRVRRMFAAIARSYDLNNRLHSLGRDQAWRRRAVRMAAVAPTDDVLDVACGTGDLAEAFAAAGPASVTGLDFTAPMLEIAGEKARGRDRKAGRPVPRYVEGDAMALPFEDASFDIVSIAFGIRNVTEPARAVSEFARVLRPGGRVIILEFSVPRQPVLRRLNDFYCGRVMPVTASWIARDRSGAYRYLPKSVGAFMDREAMAGLLAEAGLEPAEPVVMTFGICVGYLGRK